MNINDTLQFQNVGLPEDILRMKHHGDYENAIKLIDIRLKDENLPQCLRYCLQVQREMMVRMPIEFPYTYGEALAIIREHIPDFSKEEMEALSADLEGSYKGLGVEVAKNEQNEIEVEWQSQKMMQNG